MACPSKTFSRQPLSLPFSMSRATENLRFQALSYLAFAATSFANRCSSLRRSNRSTFLRSGWGDASSISSGGGGVAGVGSGGVGNGNGGKPASARSALMNFSFTAMEIRGLSDTRSSGSLTICNLENLCSGRLKMLCLVL
jgi:hypothetical protein